MKKARLKKYFTLAGILACVSSVKLAATSASFSVFTKSDFSKTSTGLSPPSETSN